MKLQLSIFAQDLKGGSDPYAVVAYIYPAENMRPTTIGKIEAIKDAKDPDFTKIFILEDFELGKPMHILVTIRDEGSNKSMGCTIFEVGSILGQKGGSLGTHGACQGIAHEGRTMHQDSRGALRKDLGNALRRERRSKT